MKTFLISLFTRSNITLLLSIIGSVGTVSSWIHHWITTRINFSISVNGYSYVESKGLLLHATFSNHSRLSLSINDICLKSNDLEYSCSAIPQKVLEITNRRGKDILSHHEYFSMDFPINISPLSGKSGYVYFPLDSKISLTLPNTVDFVICTNRGKVRKMSLLLSTLLD